MRYRPRANVSFELVTDDLPHSKEIAEDIFGAHVPGLKERGVLKEDWSIPLGYSHGDVDTMPQRWAHWIAQVDEADKNYLDEEDHARFHTAQKIFTERKKKLLDAYRKTIKAAAASGEDEALKDNLNAFRARLVFGEGGYQDFANVLRGLKTKVRDRKYQDNLPYNDPYVTADGSGAAKELTKLRQDAPEGVDTSKRSMKASLELVEDLKDKDVSITEDIKVDETQLPKAAKGPAKEEPPTGTEEAPVEMSRSTKRRITQVGKDIKKPT